LAELNGNPEIGFCLGEIGERQPTFIASHAFPFASVLKDFATVFAAELHSPRPLVHLFTATVRFPQLPMLAARAEERWDMKMFPLGLVCRLFVDVIDGPLRVNIM